MRWDQFVFLYMLVLFTRTTRTPVHFFNDCIFVKEKAVFADKKSYFGIIAA